MKKIRRATRVQIAHEIRRQLPWAHIIVGAPGHNFMEISRGEEIRGSESTGSKVGYTGSAWSRAMLGSYVIHADFAGGWVECWRHMEPKVGETERMVGNNRWPMIQPDQSPRKRLKAVADWLVSLAVTHLPIATTDGVRLAKGERFVCGPNELPELQPVKATT